MQNLKEISIAKDFKNIITSLKSDNLIVIIESKLVQFDLFKNLIDEIKVVDNKKIQILQVESGEKLKTLKQYGITLEEILKNGVHRNSHLIAIGGGALSDFSGFIASTLLRGICWSVFPTTFLSMIDASIGGKTALNSSSGKNLIGTFHLPDTIYFDKEVLQTLPEKYVDAGKGELLKYIFLDENISKKSDEVLSAFDLIFDCANYKKTITSEDFKESGNRKILNLGHTFGHVFEKRSSLEHGIAVFWGMAFIFLMYEKNELLGKLIELKNKFKIEVGASPFSIVTFEEILKLLVKDKKMQSNDEIDIIVINKIGQSEIIRESLDNLRIKFEKQKEKIRGFNI